MSGRLRLGLIGTGWITDLHLDALDRLGRTSLVGVVSAIPDRAERIVERRGGTAYRELTTMLDEQRPDVAYVCQPPHRAAAACRTLIERGIPFLTEKPLAASRADAESVGAVLAGRDLVVAVGYQWRALDFLPLVRDRLAQRPARLILGRWTGTLPGPSWWRHVAESGGQVVEQATHLYDLARLLVGEPTVVAALSARSENPDVPDADVDTLATAILRFDSGAVGSFTNAWILASSQIGLELLADGMRTIIHMPPGHDRPTWQLVLDDGGARETIPTRRDPYELQAERFLDAVEAHDPTAVLSTYEDALVTDRLVRSVVAATGSSG
jgi:myo-inositol 2-dehydrogenase / D-chiro-inositol 1-dehydrogenase